MDRAGAERGEGLPEKTAGTSPSRAREGRLVEMAGLPFPGYGSEQLLFQVYFHDRGTRATRGERPGVSPARANASASERGWIATTAFA